MYVSVSACQPFNVSVNAIGCQCLSEFLSFVSVFVSVRVSVCCPVSVYENVCVSVFVNVSAAFGRVDVRRFVWENGCILMSVCDCISSVVSDFVCDTVIVAVLYVGQWVVYGSHSYSVIGLLYVLLYAFYLLLYMRGLCQYVGAFGFVFCVCGSECQRGCAIARQCMKYMTVCGLVQLHVR